MNEELRILILEDLPSDVELAERELRTLLKGYTLHVVDTERDFLEALTAFAPDLIISDYMLPTFDGLSALKTARKQFPFTPFVILTGSMNEDTAVECMKAGADDYVIKEHMKRLGPAVRSALEKKKIEKEHHQAMVALQASEERLRVAQNIANIGDWSWDIGSGRVEWSDQTYKIFKAPQEETSYDFAKSFVHPDDLELWQSTIQEAVDKQGPFKFDHRAIRSDGTTIWVHNETEPVFNEGGELTGYLGTVQDITETKRTEEALRRSEERYRELAENLNDVLYAVDAGGTITYVSPSVESVLGHAPADLIGNDFADLVHPDDLGTIHRAFEDILQGRLHPSEYRIRSRKGEYRWVRTSSRPVREGEQVTGLRGMLTDITERKASEHALKESEERYRSLFRDALDMIHMVDQEGRITDANPVELETMGYSREEYIGKRLFDLVHPDCRDETTEGLRTVLAGREVQRYETALVTKSGEKVHVEANAVPRIEGGKIVGARAILRNITERKRAEEARAQLEEQFHQAQKLESIGRLAGGVAHDLNNLLAPILGYGEMLLEDAVGVDPRREALQEIVKASLRARDLVRQLLAFSRKQALEFKRIEVNSLLRNFERLLRRTVREDITIHMVLAESLPPVKGDAGQMEQVILNLAVNAQDAMPEGGTLTIETARVELDESYAAERQGVTPGSYVMLVVSDTGCGMDAETRNHLFEPFFTTKGKEKGTGLGLATVYGIVKQHGGNVWAYGEPGLGATFKVYLPVSTESADDEEDVSRTPLDLNGSETVLLVEDNEQLRKLALTILEQKGYRVLSAASGQEALFLLNHRENQVHLLLTDVVMPDMNGKDLFERASGLHPNLKVLYMSGYTDDVIVHHGVLDAGVHFIQKPFSVNALAAKVREVLDR